MTDKIITTLLLLCVSMSGYAFDIKLIKTDDQLGVLIFKFQDGKNTCYLTNDGLANYPISCVKDKE